MIVEHQINNCKGNLRSFQNWVSAQIIHPGIRTDLSGRDTAAGVLLSQLLTLDGLD